MKFGVVVFPGSNCDDDMMHVLSTVFKQDVVKLWHKDDSLKGFNKGDCVVLPGGFSFGDYVRSGAIAQLSPIMRSVKAFADSGDGYVLGVCNGFQILCESGLLPGVLLRNANQKFICNNIYIRSESEKSPITSAVKLHKALKIPIAHAEGRYFADDVTLDALEKNDQILFRYCDAKGNVTEDSNPNGAARNIAGICNVRRNVFGLMPHPERASEQILGNKDGYNMFKSLIG